MQRTIPAAQLHRRSASLLLWISLDMYQFCLASLEYMDGEDFLAMLNDVFELPLSLSILIRNNEELHR